jgi:isoleucyl-tRNA synthetase
VSADDVIVSERPREGWSVVNDQGETVALDVELTPELLRAGRAREVIRLVQEARKRSGFDVSDRIDLWWRADGDTAEAIRAHADLISGEVLASSMEQGQPGPTSDSTRAAHQDADLGLTFWISRRAG